MIFAVAPLAGAWIEIQESIHQELHQCVALLAGAWIEIEMHSVVENVLDVAPLAGAWIEILKESQESTSEKCRTPRGCVD